MLNFLSNILIIIRRPDVARPVRPLNLTAKLKDAANTSAPELSFQRKAVEDFHSRQAQVSQPAENDNLPASSTLDSHAKHVADSADTASTPQNKRPFSSITSDSDDKDVDGQSAQCSSILQASFFLKI